MNLKWKTKEWASLTEFLNMEQFMKDVEVITDTARDPKVIKAQVGMSLMRN